ncbi:MAG: hypothetical protein QOJ29_2411 [Thermoleophilaceae bacterium]|jgi:hypothetical protein|nr:hypothetical protein [Thermoleophilaceae bacterium]
MRSRRVLGLGIGTATLFGLTTSPATTAQTEAYLATQNGTLGTGGGFYAGKTVYASDPNFTSCTLPVPFP